MLDKLQVQTSHETRVEDDALIRGHGRFAADDPLPGQTFGYFVRSPHAFAKIAGIDTAAALKAPGVLAVITAADLEAENIGNLTRHPPVVGRGGTKLVIPPRLPLAKERVMHIGEPVAMVIAETALAAQDASELVTVDYQELTPVTDLREATKAGAPLLWPDIPNNIALDWTGPETNTDANVAEVDRIIASAAHVARLSMTSQRIAGVPMEPRGASATYNKTDDSYLMRICSQGSAPVRDGMAAVLGHSRLRVITDDVGGGFGLKGGTYPEYFALLVGAKKIGRPVHWMATRSESFLSDNEARDSVVDFELALDEKGKFLALRVRLISNLGAYLAPPGALIQTASMTRCLPSVYAIKHVDVQGTCVHTNTLPVGAYRGAGRPEANYFLERVVEEAARITGIDSAKLRRRNLVKAKAFPYKNAIGLTIDSGDFEAVLDHAMSLADYDGFKQRKKDSAKNGKLRGLGLACFLEHSGATPFESASIVFPDDGSLIVGLGVGSSGQGHATVFRRLVVDRLGLDATKVRTKAGDTDMALAGGPAVGSRSAQAVGAALVQTMNVMVEKGRKIAGQVLEASDADIEFAGGNFQVVGTDRRISLFDLAKRAKEMKASGAISETLDTKEKVDAGLTFPNGCHIAEVEIERDTGVVQIVAYTAVDDSGVILNERIVEGQIHGGIAQGVGQVLMESTVYQEGQIVTASFMDYAMPRAHHFSDIRFASHPVPCTTNPLGVKGVGEAGTTGSLPAVMNAIIDAIPGDAGATMDMPATAEKVWLALQQGSAQA